MSTGKKTKLKREVIKEEVLELKQQAGNNILVGSPSLIVALTQLDLIDEYQLSVQPIILGNGLPLLKNINHRINLKLFKTKTFGCGAITHYYEPTKNDCQPETHNFERRVAHAHTGVLQKCRLKESVFQLL